MLRFCNIPYLPHECMYPLDSEYTNPDDLYFDRSLEDNGYIAAVSVLHMFQLDNALQYT